MPRVIDISVRLGASLVTFPGDPPFRREETGEADDAGGCLISDLSLCAHAGTHLDAPAHFIPGGARLDTYPLARFVLPARVVALPGVPLIRPEHLPVSLPTKGAVLFKTDNSFLNRQKPPFDPGYVGLSADAARELAARGLSLVGIDYLSIEPWGVDLAPTHRALLSRDILILEGLDLREAEAGDYTLICPPLSLENAEGAPTRAFLLAPPLDDPS